MGRILNNGKEKKEIAFEWFGWTEDEKFTNGYETTNTGFARQMGITYPTMLKWRKQWHRIKEAEEAVEIDGQYDSKATLKKFAREADQKLMERIRSGKANANDFKIFYTVIDQLKEKTEMELKIGLSAEETARRNLAAIRSLQQGGYRMDEMPLQPGVLHDELCLPSGQHQTGDSAVAAVASPAGTAIPSPQEGEGQEADTGLQVEADRS